MCGLCGLLGAEDHWSAGARQQASADPVRRRKERAARVRVINDVLASRRLTLRDWQGEAFMLSGPTGKSVIVDNVTEVWAAMDAEFGGAFDPLAEAP